MLLCCHMEPRDKPSYGLYLKRSWLRPGNVFFRYTNNDPSVNDSFKGRVSVRGDPSDHSVNVTISQLTAADTDRYTCEFMLERVGSEDEKIQGNSEVFLHVSSGESPPKEIIIIIIILRVGSSKEVKHPEGSVLFPSQRCTLTAVLKNTLKGQGLHHF